MNAPSTERRLRIVAVNDVYVLDELPRLASVVEAARTQDPADRLLVTVAGDFLAPSLLSSLDEGRGMVDCLNALGVTHVTLGNHEDDLEFADLLARLEELHAQVLLTNAPDFRGRHVGTDVVDVGGLPVGLVGVVNGDPSLYRRPPFGGATLGVPNDAVVAEAQRLRAQGCVAVVALTHQWLQDDRALAKLGAVELILGGHEHEGYLELDHAVPLAKAPLNATSAILAELTLTTDHAGVTRAKATARFEPVAGYPEDGAMRARVEQHLAPVRELEGRTLLSLPAGLVLTSAGSRLQQTSIGTLVASRLRDALGAEVGVFNGGGLRGDTDRRDRLTYADFCEELPFDNEAVVVSMPGAVIREAIRFSRTERRGTGGFLQVDDAARVDDAHELHALCNAPLDPAREYRVAIVRDLMVGGDKLVPLMNFALAHPSAVPPETTGLDVKVAILRTFAGGSGPRAH